MRYTLLAILLCARGVSATPLDQIYLRFDPTSGGTRAILSGNKVAPFPVEIVPKKSGFTVKAKKDTHGFPKKFHLNMDGGRPHEWIAACVFESLRYPAPSARLVIVTMHMPQTGWILQRSDLGVIVEGTTTSFLDKHFGNGNGNLYEGPGDVDQPLDIDGGNRNSDYQDLKRLAEAARAPVESRMEELSKVLELDRAYTYLAVERILGNPDGYGQRHNYRIYNNPATGRFVFLPHGFDQFLPGGKRAQLGLVERALIETPGGRAELDARVESLTNQVFRIVEQACLKLKSVLANPGNPHLGNGLQLLPLQTISIMSRDVTNTLHAIGLKW